MNIPQQLQHPPPSPASIISYGWPDSQSKRSPYQRPYPPPSPGFAPNLRTIDSSPPPLSNNYPGEFPSPGRNNGPASPTMSGRGGEYRMSAASASPSSFAGGRRSSNGSVYMSSDPSAAQRRKQGVMEETLGQHYYVLSRYLASTAQDEAMDAKPSRARDKLPRLSPTQFQELSTDVYDEFQRRQAVAARQGGAASPDAPPPPAYLLPVQGFYPERNQARQKLSTLPAPKFRHLARDVFYELGRRIPKFTAGDIPRQDSPSMRGPPSRTGTPSGMRPNSRPIQQRQGSLASQVFAGGVIGGAAGADGPMQKSLQNNTIIPNKSYLVEDDDEDGDSVYGFNRRDTTAVPEKVVAEYQNKIDELQARVDELQGKVTELEEKTGDLDKQVEEKDALVVVMTAAQEKHEQETTEANERYVELQSSLEAKLVSAQALNDSLQMEIDKARELHAEKDLNIDSLRGQLDTIATKSSNDEQTKARYAAIEQESQELQQDNQELQQELLEQQRVTDEVRREAAGFLEEMKLLSKQSADSFEREEYLAQQVHVLEDEIARWKDRYARSKAQKRAADIEITVGQPHLEGNAYLHAKGLIADYHIIEYQVAIDEALRMSRKNPKGLLSHMKSVIMAVKHITDDLEGLQNSPALASKLLTRISGSACNYITATKNFVYAAGVSPVSLVDAAASHLTAAIIEAVHEVKMHPSEGVGEDDFLPEMLDQRAKMTSAAGRSSVSESVYSTTTTTTIAQNQPRQAGLNANGTLTSGVYQATSYGAEKAGSISNGNAAHLRNGSLAARPTAQPIRNGSYTNGNTIEPQPRAMSSASSTRTDSFATAGTHEFSLREQEDISVLTSFLEDTTSQLSETIQSLVSLIRGSTSLASAPTVSKTITSITTTVDATLTRTRSVLDKASASSPLRSATTSSISALQSARQRMLTVEEAASRASGKSVGDWKDVVNGLPPIAFEIAREVRELTASVGDLRGDAGGDGEDFS